MSSKLRNSVILSGNVGSDPNVRYNDSGSVVAKISIATKDSWRDKKSGEWQEKTTWHTVEAWGDLAKTVEKRIQKGTNLTIEGKLSNNSYEDKNGQKHTYYFVQMNEFQIHSGGVAKE